MSGIQQAFAPVRILARPAARLLALAFSAALFAAATAANAQSLDDLRKQLETPWKAKDWPAAEAIARQITTQPLASAADWRNLTTLLAMQGKKPEAFAARQELVKRPGANSKDHNSICWYQLEQNKPLDARPACTQAVELDTSNYAALVNLGHTFLLAGDKVQAMGWYRKTLAHIQKDEELQQGPQDDFKLFIKNGWAVPDAQASQQWFEQTWPKLRALRQARIAAMTSTPPEASKTLEALQQLLAGRMQVIDLVGDGTEADRFVQTYVDTASNVLDDLIDEKHQHAAAIAFVDGALQAASTRLPDAGRWKLLQRLKIDLLADEQRALAQAVRERLYAEQLAKLGAEHPSTLDMANELAVALYNTGQFDKALALNEKVLAARQTKLGADHPDTLTSMGNLASTYSDLGQNDKALALKEKVLAARQTKLGADHPGTLTSMSNLASTYSALGQGDKAKKLYESLLTAYEKQVSVRASQVGEDHPYTLNSLNMLANIYARLNQYNKALPLREKVLAARQSQLGTNHPDTLAAMVSLATTCFNLDLYHRALALEEKVLVGRTAELGADHRLTLESMGNLALTLFAIQQFERSDAMYEELLKRHIRIMVPASLDTADVLSKFLRHRKSRSLPAPKILDQVPDQLRKEAEKKLAISEGSCMLLNTLGGFVKEKESYGWLACRGVPAMVIPAKAS